MSEFDELINSLANEIHDADEVGAICADTLKNYQCIDDMSTGSGGTTRLKMIAWDRS